MHYSATIHGQTVCMYISKGYLEFKVNDSFRHQPLSEIAKFGITRWLLKCFKEIKANISTPIKFIAYDGDEHAEVRFNIYMEVAHATSINADTFYIFPGGYTFNNESTYSPEDNEMSSDYYCFGLGDEPMEEDVDEYETSPLPYIRSAEGLIVNFQPRWSEAYQAGWAQALDNPDVVEAMGGYVDWDMIYLMRSQEDIEYEEMINRLIAEGEDEDDYATMHELNGYVSAPIYEDIAF